MKELEGLKVIVAGAGIGGLAAAKELGKAGAEVTVYERADSVDEMRYPWHDDVQPEAFARAGLDVPEGSFRKKNWTFVTPDGAVRRMYEAEEKADFSVWRRALNRELVKSAEEYAEIKFSTAVEGAIAENGRVKGIIANGEKVYADLVVDSLGAFSSLKKDVPGVTVHEADEIFVTYRAFRRKNADAPEAEYTNKVYLKHKGERGIAWAIQDGDEVDVLAGRLGGANEEEFASAIAQLEKENPTIGAETVRGGGMYRIPVRYPATRMVADGYAAIGDAAYMTVPMLGSGIATSLAAAGMLAKCLTEAAGKGAEEAVSVKNLWNYERDFYLAFGAEFCGVDVTKRGVLEFDDALLGWLLSSGVLTNDDVCALAKGRFLNIGVKEALRKVKAAGLKKLPALLRVNAMLTRGKRAIKTARRIPAVYAPRAVGKWERKLVKAVTGKDIRR